MTENLAVFGETVLTLARHFKFLRGRMFGHGQALVNSCMQWYRCCSATRRTLPPNYIRATANASKIQGKKDGPVVHQGQPARRSSWRSVTVQRPAAARWGAIRTLTAFSA
jgi:hypothetical protein